MSGLVQERKSTFDTLMWLIAIGLAGAGIFANWYYADIAWSLRAAGLIVLLSIILAIGLQTAQGKLAFSFAKAARLELRKVVWPNRQETMQTTIVVIIAVMLMAIILWLIDSGLMWAIGMLTARGQ